MGNSDEINNIINPVIKGERPTYHLITEEKLNDLIQNSFAGSICFVLFSILVGAAITEKDWIYFLIGVVFFSFSLYFYWRKIKFIRKTKKSGEVRSFEYEATENDDSKLTVVKAIYGTPPDNTVDITNILNDKISENKLSFVASNKLAGDPRKGFIKTLEIEYKTGNKIIKKKYSENENVNLP
ncbi:hypothetical protein HOD96_00250 [Candidatus Falkowbacteria bacterium]|jgi:hypothetical protein|nr:hypothetical protein [Candidatus Falkowbacteria bacterium]MBT4432842.1 hypothetical protein [Candidatus Falkowbacteria bacterium]